MYENLQEAVHYIQKNYPFDPEVGIVLGTGLGDLAKEVIVVHEIPYHAIPFFPNSTVESHAGKLILGKISGKKVAVLQGRIHFYEGFSMQEVVFPIRILHLLGIKNLLLSNAAGALNPDFGLSDLMLIEDHIDFLSENPLIGRNIDQIGTRFPDMFEPYSQKLIELAHQVAQENDLQLKEGVYVAVKGPNLETRAEYKMFRSFGADAIGMSTVPEVIAAVHANLPVLAVSVMTDLCSPNNLKPVTLSHVLKAAADAEPKLALLFREIVKRL